MPGIEVRGTDQLRALGRTLKATGDKDLRAMSRAALRKGTKPGIAAARARARATLPRHGGFAELMGRSRINTTIRESGRQVGIRITTKTHDPRIDKGFLSHPTFGHRDRWVVQRVPAGWFTTALRTLAPEMRRELLRSMQQITNRIRSSHSGPR